MSPIYEGGRLARAVTRGDGSRGEVVTANAKTIRSIPLRIKEDEEKGKKQSPLFDGSMKEIEVRGEVHLPNDV